MIGETYEVQDIDKSGQFFFISEGSKGRIFKYVVFTEVSENVFNLGFGDLKNGEISDSVVSNNNDLIKVMNTIGAIIYRFIENHPERIIQVEPVDVKRSRLYHTIFRRRIQEINLIFVLQGNKIRDIWEVFETDEIYRKFRLTKIETI